MFNSQCSILIPKEKRPHVCEPAYKTNDPCCKFIASVEHFAIRHPLRMRIEHWELSIGQIPDRIHGQRILPSYFCASPKDGHRIERRRHS